MIRPILEYTTSVWDPHTKKSISKIEMVQCRVACFTFNRYHNNSSVEEMLEILEQSTLQQRQHAVHLTNLSKITNSLACVKNHDLTSIPCSGRRGHYLKYKQIRCRTDYRSNTFIPHTIRAWNKIPPEVAHVPSLGTFISRVSSLM